MPPGQPLRSCDECGLIRPCRPHRGRVLCVECNPTVPVAYSDDDEEDDDHDGVAVDDGVEPPVATDGGGR